MADDTNTDLAVEVATSDTAVDAPVVKKQRAARRTKAAIAAAEAMSAPADGDGSAKPAGRGRGKKAASPPMKAETPTKAKATRVKKVAQPVEPRETTPATARDEMEDLIQLEEENKRLRKLLSEKLRSENADLRKRLGQN